MRTSETTAVLVPSGATKLRVTVEGDGQLWKVNLGRSHPDGQKPTASSTSGCAIELNRDLRYVRLESINLLTLPRALNSRWEAGV